MNPLLDKDFLLDLDTESVFNLFARITLLDWDENPIERIEGKVSTGSLSIDGNSAMRRTCSLTFIAAALSHTNKDYYLNTKFKLELGILNDINDQYDKIIWFKQGIFVFTTFNVSLATNSYNVSISGKDKMCLLNGDVGGNLSASINFDLEEYVDKLLETTIRNKIPIVTIIKNLVTIWGRELPENVSINDLDPYGFELLQYHGDQTLYFIYQGDELIQITFDPFVQWVNKDGISDTTLDKSEMSEAAAEIFVYNTMGLGKSTPTEIQFKSSYDPSDHKVYTIGRCETGQTAGYRLCDLIYPGDLTSNIGDSIVAMLDKIKAMLGNQYEYFYDIDGRFVFQKKPGYAAIYRSIFSDQEDYIKRPSSFQDYISYFFNDLSQISQIQVTPTLTGIKNDYSVWGSRTAVSGQERAILYRYALDKKPEKYKTLPFTSETGVQYRSHVYQTHTGNSETTQLQAKKKLSAAGKKLQDALVEANNEEDLVARINMKANAYNEYEQTLEDDDIIELIDWDYRELIYRMALDYYRLNQNDDFLIWVEDANPQTCINGKTNYEQYYTDLLSFWQDLYRLEYAGLTDQLTNHTYDDNGYNINLEDSPWMLDFYFELSGEDTELDKYLIPAIGDRTKVVNESSIKSLYYAPVPESVYYTELSDGLWQLTTNYTKIHLTESIANLFSISAQGTSAYDKMKDLLYDHTYCAEKVNLTVTPIYYLQPNTRVSITAKDFDIDGEYIISKISISIDGKKGTMQVEANKASEEII